jgi:hypothetical protein
MWLTSWLQTRTPNRPRRGLIRPRAVAPRFRPQLEALEDRTLPSTYMAGSVHDLIADINAANRAGGANTIILAPNTTFDLAAVNNNTNGANGLPVIGGKKAQLTIVTLVGNGDVIERSSAAGTPAFRLFDVTAGSSLILENVTLQNGLAQGAGSAAEGGAIYNQGGLTLIGVSVQNNAAQGSNGSDGVVASKLKDHQTIDVLDGQAGGDAAGGGIWSSGSVALQGGTILQGNQALGGRGGAAGWLSDGTTGNGGAGGSGYGGGLYVAGFQVSMIDVTLYGNTAGGGDGGANLAIAPSVSPTEPSAGAGGSGSGGGLYVADGALQLSSVIVQANEALGGSGGGSSNGTRVLPGRGGDGSGGGIAVAAGTVTLDTVDLLSNIAWGAPGGGVQVGFGGTGGNGFGGGLYVAAGTVTMTNDTLSGNWASGAENGGNGEPVASPQSGVGEGGGIYNAGALTLSGCTISSNVAYDDFNNEFSPSSARGDGGGIFNAASGVLDVTSGSTVTGNYAVAGADLYNLGTADISSDSTVGLIGP